MRTAWACVIFYTLLTVSLILFAMTGVVGGGYVYYAFRYASPVWRLFPTLGIHEVFALMVPLWFGAGYGVGWLIAACMSRLE